MFRRAYQKGQDNFKALMSCTPPVTYGVQADSSKSPFCMGFHGTKRGNVGLDHDRNDLVQSNLYRNRFQMQQVPT